jgi:hypothetical protein
MINLKDIEILLAFDLYRRRRFRFWITFALATARKEHS